MRNVLREETIAKYSEKVELKYKSCKLTKTQKEIMMWLLIANDLTMEEIRNNDDYFFVRTNVSKIGDNEYLMTANTRTIEALEKKGLIEIIKIGSKFSDTIKLK